MHKFYIVQELTSDNFFLPITILFNCGPVAVACSDQEIIIRGYH
jgi:hypothetical protein